MKLNKTTIAGLNRLTTEAESPKTQSMLDGALAMARAGWLVFPLSPGSKKPLIGKKQGGRAAKDGTTDEVKIRGWWTASPNAGIGISMGDDLLGIDWDFDHGADEVALDLWPETRTHYSGKRNGNRHLIYRYEPGSLASRLPSHTSVIGDAVDTRIGDGAYLVAPPTRHEETGHPYWVGDENAGEIHLLTDDELQGILDALGIELGKPKLRVMNGGKGTAKDRPAGATLTELLDNPPAEGGRNDWLTRVAGHYARTYVTQKDTYWTHVEAANAKLTEPLPQAEMSKTAESIWDTENAKPTAAAGDSTGYLVSQDGHLMATAKINDEPVLIKWGDFDLVASGVAVDKDHRLTYWATLVIDGRRIDTTVPGEMFGDDRAMKKWLAGYGAVYREDDAMRPKAGPGWRLQKYLSSQDPPRVDVTERLGLQPTHEGDLFVTLDGVIDANGFRSKEEVGIVADRSLVERDLAPYMYGFERSREEAVEVLRRVLEFQEPSVTSVFGAWWSACWLKSMIHEVSSLFPFMGIEAVSGSGKTKGFFGLMVQLNGYVGKQAITTPAAMRDRSGSNYNGLVWIDDADKLDRLGELLRASTTNGEMQKKGNDNTANVTARIVAPILLSGETLGFDDQKAMVDRSILLTPPPAAHRKNAQGEDQWNDIQDLQSQYRARDGGLAVLSGWYVQIAMRHEAEVLRVIRHYPKAARAEQKYAVLEAGAMLLDTMLGGGDEWVADGEHLQRVRAWIRGNAADRLEYDNTLTLKILPDALRQTRFPKGPEETVDDGFARGMDVPAWISVPKAGQLGEPRVFFRADHLADYWSKTNRAVVERTETSVAIRQQAHVLGIKSTMQGPKARRVKAYELPPEYAAKVLDRAEFVNPNES